MSSKIERENLSDLQKQAVRIGFKKSEEIDLGIGARLDLNGGQLFLCPENNLYITGNLGDPGTYGFVKPVKNIDQIKAVWWALK